MFLQKLVNRLFSILAQSNQADDVYQLWLHKVGPNRNEVVRLIQTYYGSERPNDRNQLAQALSDLPYMIAELDMTPNNLSFCLRLKKDLLRAGADVQLKEIICTEEIEDTLDSIPDIFDD